MSAPNLVIAPIDAFEVGLSEHESQPVSVISEIKDRMANIENFAWALASQDQADLRRNLERSIDSKEKFIQKIAKRHAAENGVSYATQLIIYYARRSYELERNSR